MKFLQFLTYETPLIIRRASRFHKKLSKSKTSLSPKFLDSVKLWPKLLEEENKVQHEKLSQAIHEKRSWYEIEERGLCKGNLIMKDIYTDATNGQVAVFEGTGFDRSKFLQSLSPGVPVTVSSLDENENLKTISSGHIVSCDSSLLKVCVYQDDVLAYNCPNYVITSSPNLKLIKYFQELAKDHSKLSSQSVHLVNLAYRSTTMPSIHDRKVKTLAESLNDSQRAAVSAALNTQRNLLCIQGPPGTGKTRVIAEIVHSLISRKKKVLVCAPTHVAVRNALDATKRRMEQDIDKQKVTELLMTLSDLKKEVENHPLAPKLLELTRDMKANKSRIPDYFNLRSHVYKSIFAQRNAIFGTLATSFIQRLQENNWKADVILVDEAAQCTEPSTWFPLLTTPSCKKLVLVGDQKQLPAVILSEKALENQFNVSLMEKLAIDFSTNNVSIVLKEQFRMNKKIMKWSNEVFYEDQLIAHPSVSDITLSDICSNLKPNHVLNNPILMIDMDKIGRRSREKSDDNSFINQDETKIVVDYVHRLVIDLGLHAKKIAVIAPYYAQIQQLRRSIRFPVDINTVDAFQGHERQVVIFCLVRDNQEGSIGFLRETRRLNVAITRAKRQFVLIGSANMLKRNKHLKRLYNYLKDENVILGPEILKTSENFRLPS